MKFQVIVSRHSTFPPIEVEADHPEEALEIAIERARHYEPETEDWQEEKVEAFHSGGAAASIQWAA